MAALSAVEPPKSDPLPDVSPWRLPWYDEAFFQGRAVCGEEAQKFWLQSANWRRHAEGNPVKVAQFERLLGGDPQQVAKVFKGERVNEHHLTLAEKRKARGA